MPATIIPGSFVATSDFHSHEWPLSKVTDYYIHEYETVYILGDAIDRGSRGDGSGGIDILCKIKELTERYAGRVIYIPGNHDSFLYDFGTYNIIYAHREFERNGGSRTIKDITRMKKKNPTKAEELLDWLGSLPIQRIHIFNEQKYALAHAYFNQKLFEINPDFCLRDMCNALEAKDMLFELAYNVIWFRKDSYTYLESDVPSGDTEVIIGHTPPMFRESESLDLTNEDGETVKVHCVDGGITYSQGGMHKFVSGTDTTVSTAPKSHSFIAPVVKSVSNLLKK